MNLIEFDAAIDTHIAAWNPTTIVRDNDPARTKKLDEYIRVTVINGNAFIDEPAGVRSVNGSTVLHPFILQFDVFTRLNLGVQRNNQLCQEVLDHWQVRNLETGLHLIAGGVDRIGEQGTRFHQIVSVDGRREEFLTVRP